MKQSEINALNILNNISADSTADTLEKSMGHKYFKREGVPGHYKYYYTEADYKAGRSSSSEGGDKPQQEEAPSESKESGSGKKDGKGKDFKLKYLLGQTESKFKQINISSIENHLKDLSQDSRISDLEGRLAMDCLRLVYTSKEISSWYKDESVKDNHVLTLAKTALNNIIDVKQMIAEITN